MPGARDLYRALVVDESALGDTVYGQAIRGFVTRLGAAFPDHALSLRGRYADVRWRAVLAAWKFMGASDESRGAPQPTPL